MKNSQLASRSVVRSLHSVSSAGLGRGACVFVSVHRPLEILSLSLSLCLCLFVSFSLCHFLSRSLSLSLALSLSLSLATLCSPNIEQEMIVNYLRRVLLVFELPTPRQLCSNGSPRPSEDVPGGLCHSLSVDLSNTAWAQTGLKNELSENVIL